jgi:hypothetical protein
MTSRRRFLADAGLGAAALAFSQGRVLASNQTWDEQPIAVFEKVFEGLNYEEFADAMESTGAAGPEATIRPGGHIEPASAGDEVPRMSAALKSRGRRIVIAATHIRRTDEPYTESLLKTFKSEGIRFYRMGHYFLDPSRSLKHQVAEYGAQVKDLAAMNAAYGVQGLYQNHSGSKFLGALVCRDISY